MSTADRFPYLFRGTVWPRLRLLLAIALPGLLLCGGMMAFARPAPGRAPVSELGLAYGACFVLLLAVAPLVWRLKAIRVGPAGLRTPRILGGRVVPWDARMRVWRSRLFGVAYLELWAAGLPHPVRMPADLTDPEGAVEAVAEFAGPNHPLTEALRERLAGG